MKKKAIIICTTAITTVLVVALVFILGLKPVSDSKKNVKFTVGAGKSKVQIIDDLKTANLIKSKLVTMTYVFLNRSIVLQAGNYELNESMSTQDILKKIAKGDTIESHQDVTLKLIEGKTIKKYAEVIAKEFNLDEDEILDTLSDKEYLQELINKYWFITDSILADGIKYPLEGYFFPDTYKIPLKYDIKQIVGVILDNMEKKLEPYKSLIENGKYNVHEYLTIASIVEMEGIASEDRKSVSQVIYKRLDTNMPLGMDVTTYYAVDKEMTDVLTANDLRSTSPYNTRNVNMTGKLPIGPITNSSLESIDATFNPSNTNYVYFYADVKTKKVFFASTYEEFLKYKAELGG
ncbi:MAG: endolytic transglycosylase MltG [Bacilli bacterium]|nr:endolytic transglycosylase MltG [Bacilli bacterium]